MYNELHTTEEEKQAAMDAEKAAAQVLNSASSVAIWPYLCDRSPGAQARAAVGSDGTCVCSKRRRTLSRTPPSLLVSRHARALVLPACLAYQTSCSLHCLLRPSRRACRIQNAPDSQMAARHRQARRPRPWPRRARAAAGKCWSALRPWLPPPPMRMLVSKGSASNAGRSGQQSSGAALG